jgi:hypothetical protein
VTLLVPPPSKFEGTYDPHNLEIWDGDEKVFSACWEDPDQPEVRLMVQEGLWKAKTAEPASGPAAVE